LDPESERMEKEKIRTKKKHKTHPPQKKQASGHEKNNRARDKKGKPCFH